MNTRIATTFCLLLALIALPAAGQEAASPEAERFDTLLQKIQTSPGSANDAEVMDLIELGEQLGRTYTASIAVKQYLGHNFKPSAPVMRAAADTAYRAADFPTAAGRYKAYIELAGNKGEGASEAAATLYHLLVDILGQEDDAYQFMAGQGHELRDVPAARRWDRWFIAQARRREDHKAMADRVAVVLNDKLPIAQEQLRVWDGMEWVMANAAYGEDKHFSSLPAVRRIAGSVRADAARKARYNFYVANLNFMANAAGKDEQTLDRAFEAMVLPAARDYLKQATTLATVQDIYRVFNGKEGDWTDQFRKHLPARQQFFADAFVALSSDDRDRFLNWRLGNDAARGRLIGQELWSQLALKEGKYFQQSSHADEVPFARRAEDRQTFKRQSDVLKSVPSYSAAVINATAAGDDLAAMLEHLGKQETWHLDFNAIDSIANNHLWPNWAQFKGGEPSKDEHFRAAYAAFGRKYIAPTPVALFDPEAVDRWLVAAWAELPTEQKSKIAEDLAAIAWVPWDNRDRQDATRDAYRDFKNWANWVRRELRKKPEDRQVDEAIAEQITGIENAFRKVIDDNNGDPAAAPNPMTRHLTELVHAQRDRNQKHWDQAADALYKLVHDYKQKKTPFGAATLRWLVDTRKGEIDNLQFQISVLEDQLANRSDDLELIRQIADEILDGSRGYRFRWWRLYDENKEVSRRLATAFEKALLARMNKGEFSEQLFWMMRGARRGDGNRMAADVGNEAVEMLIEKDLLTRTNSSVHGDIASKTVQYMWLVDREFPKLQEKYPPATWFDERFVAEAKRINFLDYRYWDYGRDEKQLVANAAADILADYQIPPLGYGDESHSYDREDLRAWHGKAMNAESAKRQKLLTKLDAEYGKTRFGTFAMGRGKFVNNVDLSEDAEARKAFFDNLKTYVSRSSQALDRVSLPYLSPIGSLSASDLTDAEVRILIDTVAEATPHRWQDNVGYEELASRVLSRLMDEQPLALYDLGPRLWVIARDTNDSDLQRTMARAVTQLSERGKWDVALALSLEGPEIAKGRLTEDARTALATIRARALGEIGGVIPVPRSDPRYDAYAAQANFLTGRMQAAWDGYLANREQIIDMMRDLDPSFLIWIIDRHTDLSEFEQAETLAKEMIRWFDSVPEGFEPQTRARLLLAFADIYMARKEFPVARSRYNTIVAAERFEDTRAQLDAEMRIAEVDRLTGLYGEAMTRLEQLARRQDTRLQAEAYYQMALVNYDQEEFAEAADNLELVFARVAEHPLAKILEGRVNLRLKNYEEPTELEMGITANQRFLVPGKPLKVQLEDKNLAVVGSSQMIEIRAWSESGDEEVFPLAPFADSKTRFTGEILSELAPVRKGDNRLQVLGGDTVYYDFSEKFKQENNITLAAPASLRVVTDAQLNTSSGKILSKAEQEQLALEKMIRERLTGGSSKPEYEQLLSTVRASHNIKPGNKINIRVNDPDRAVTADRDQLPVTIRATSGDRLTRFVLTETDTHSGVFEGAVPTAAAQAIAYALDSQDGREPNFVISSKDYPAWVALPDSTKPKWLAVDLNDNVRLGKMTVTASEPGRKLKNFYLQKSLNGETFTTIGSWPQAYEPWDGRIRGTIARYGDQSRPARSVDEMEGFLKHGVLQTGREKVTVYPDSMSINIDGSVFGKRDELGLSNNNRGSYYIAHFQAAFFNDRRQVRIFKLDMQGEDANAVLLVDGEPADPRTGEVRKSLTKGVHRIDVYVSGTRDRDVKFKVMMDTPEPPYMVEAPAEMFDVNQNPMLRDGVYQAPATITANDDATEFDIDFPVGANARVLRLLIADYETDAPAINKIKLADVDGEQVLPTSEDFMALRENDTLEIVPGDRIEITYQDPSVLTSGRELHEAFMSATYANATLSAAFVEYETGRDGVAQPRYIPMRRFEPGDVINVFINDPDMDVSDDMDIVSFTVQTYGGEPRTLDALETEEHSGVFIGKVFPTTEPAKRDSELRVQAGDDVRIEYLDQHNTEPGIPWKRIVEVEQVWFEHPEVRVYDTTSLELPEEQKQALHEAAEQLPKIEEYVPARYALQAVRPDRPHADGAGQTVIGVPAFVEVLFPARAKSPESRLEVFAQTSSGRSMVDAQPADDTFDITVPGTIRVTSGPSSAGGAAVLPKGYTELGVRGDMYAQDPLTDGRFTFSIPMELAEMPEKSLATAEAMEFMQAQPALAIRGDDTVYVGFKYTDEQGGEHWVTRTVKLHADPMLDIMDRRYQDLVDGLYVGETLYFRVIDPLKDVSDEKDELQIELVTSSDTQQTLTLTETFSHSGVFKGLVKVVHQKEADQVAAGESVIAVQYGDTIDVAYTPSVADLSPLSKQIEIYKGADGEVLPFTKRFKDPEIAVQTQFTIAEAYFELAKRHRELGNDQVALLKIQQGEKLLREALRDFPNVQARAQADYLLANLSMEFANDATNADASKRHYTEAISRFSDIVASYPESEYAPKSQFKKALVYEKMAEFEPAMIDKASEEYVKLSYRYPDNELVAETIARLGQYFLTKGRDLKTQADDLTASGEPIEAEKIRLQSRKMFTTAAEVFARLSDRFPQHNLAGKTLVLSAQCHMQAENFADAIDTFDEVIGQAQNLDPELVAEAMYWSGDCHMKLLKPDLVGAYRMFKKLEWDYPTTKWAKFARGRLTDERLAGIE